MARITKNDPEEAIIQKWRALPKVERLTEAHAAWFATK